MWLLDVNVDVHLVELLRDVGIASDTAENRGWKSLVNGALVGSAVAAGFTCLLTRDRRFGESAGRALKHFPTFAVVVITLPQLRSEEYARSFLEAWKAKPVEPLAGRLVIWP